MTSAASELPSWARLDENFEEIRVVDLDARRTTTSRVHESMRVVSLKLSRAPDRFWVRLFQENRNMRANPLRFGLWIDDEWLSFDCKIDDIEPVHLPDLQLAIDYANRRYREVLEERRAQHVDADEAPSEAAKLDALAARVRERFAQSDPDAAIAASAPAPDTAAPPAATAATRNGVAPPRVRTHTPEELLGDPAEMAEWHRRLGLDTLVTTGSKMSAYGPQARAGVPVVDTTPGPARTLLREVDLGSFEIGWSEPAPEPAPAVEPPRFTQSPADRSSTNRPSEQATDDPILEFERRRRALRERLRVAAQPGAAEPPRDDE
ncbi:MAG TPA: hypothetical protein VND91_01615 [Candidatus Saccharimonadia bacterium]|nr:hypothetical protein [Candidatus Saccharimonadia bacterium]